MGKREESKTTGRALAALEERFPHYADMVQRLAQESETFREICADFGECSETLERLAELGAGTEAKIQEYTELQAQLEHELLVCLEARSTRAGASDTRSNRSKDSKNRT